MFCLQVTARTTVSCYGKLCKTCLSRTECIICSRRLRDGSLSTPETYICNAFQRKLDNTGVRVDRTAFGVLQEVSLGTRAEDNGDLEAYLINRGEEIRATLPRFSRT